MSHPKFGEKFTCAQCGAKFYGLNKPKPTCPKCGARPKKARKTAAPKPTKRPVISTEEFENQEEEPIMEEEMGELTLGADANDPLPADDSPDQDY